MLTIPPVKNRKINAIVDHGISSFGTGSSNWSKVKPSVSVLPTDSYSWLNCRRRISIYYVNMGVINIVPKIILQFYHGNLAEQFF